MANDATIKNKIVVEGEAKYKKALAEINRSYRESKSALKAVTAEMAGNENGMTALAAQGDALQKVYDDQSAALKLMESHLVKVEDAYGKTSRQAVELRTKINNARAEMVKTGNELRELRSRLDQAADAMGDAERAADGVGDDLRDVGRGAEDAEDDVRNLADEMKELTGIDVGGTLGNLAGIAGIGSAVGGSLKVTAETQAAWTQLAASTGATGAALEDLKNDAQVVANSGIADTIGEAADAVATVHRNTGMTGASLQDCTGYALALSDTFGMDVAESSRTAGQMMETFGISGEEAYDLIAKGAQSGADKNGNLLDTINEYSPYFQGAGKSADEMFAAIITGAQNGVYDVDKIGDSWKEMTLRIAGGDEGAKQALSDLGFAAEDVSHKIAGGGEAADLATAQIIAALAATEDPYERNRLGVALFGTQWEDVAGAVLPAFGAMEDGLDDVSGSAKSLFDLKTDTFEAQWTGMLARIGAKAAQHFTPHIEQATALLTGVNAALDGESGIIEGAGNALADEYQSEVQGLMDKYGLTKEGATMLHIKGVTIDSEGAKTDQLVTWVKELYGEAETEADTQAGALGEKVVEEETSAVEEGLPDAEAAGGQLAQSTTLGFENESEGMYSAGVNAAQGTISGAMSQHSALYNAGAAAARAYRSGFQRTLEIRSPSRAAMEDMAYVGEGYLIQAQRDRERLQAAGAALGEAVRSGFGESALGADGALTGANNGSGGLTAEAVGAATARALSGMGVYMGRERVGEILEPTVSETTERRRLGTVQGLSTAAKSW